MLRRALRLSYDDPWSIQQKTGWLGSMGLLGAMVCEMSGDTATGTLMTTPSTTDCRKRSLA